MKSRIGCPASLSDGQAPVCEWSHATACLRTRLLGAEQEARGGDAGGEAVAVVAAGIGKRLQGEAVADREEVGDDRLGVIAELEHALRYYHERIKAARRSGQSEEALRRAEKEWCALLAKLNRALCEKGELDAQYSVNGQLLATFGCEDLNGQENGNGHHNASGHRNGGGHPSGRGNNNGNR